MTETRLFVKNTVSPKSLWIVAAVINYALEADLNIPIVITSANDSEHMKGSHHYTHEAIDVRTRNFPSHQSKVDFVQGVVKRLGPDYQGFLEYVGGLREHAHFEYDPRG